MMMCCRGKHNISVIFFQWMTTPKVTFWGEHCTILGWYATLEDIQKEVRGIPDAISRGDGSYALQYAADIEFVGIFGQPKCRNR